MRCLPGILLCAALCLPAARPALAGDVTLMSRDGAVEIGGHLLDFDGGTYRLDTIYGPLAVNADAVTCKGAACPGAEARVARFSLSGTPVLGAVAMPALIEGFAAARGMTVERAADGRRGLFRLRDPDDGTLRAEIALTTGSTGEGFADLLTGGADIAMADRAILPEEVAHGREAGLGDLSASHRRRLIALDAIVPVVAPDTRMGDPGRGLTLETLRGLLTGEIVDWSRIGGAEAPVTPHLPRPGAGLGRTPEARLLEGQAPGSSARQHADAAAVSGAVAADPMGVGLTRLSALGGAVQVPLAAGCGTRLLASRQGIKTGDYPFVVPLFLYLGAPQLPSLAGAFLDYLATPAAQIAMRRAGFADLMREEIPLARQGDRLALAIAEAAPGSGLAELQRMMSVLRGAVRLTETVRPGPETDEALSQSGIEALARALEAGTFDGHTLILAGFADGGDGPDADRALARKDAEAVRDALRAAATAADFGRVRLEVVAFGALLPLACTGGLPEDRLPEAMAHRLNRRVEIWLR
ncbi:cell envelope biogenesis protein OmpA [Rhodovulum sp. BSW8]|uniref:substrate-binding domain-containing protein n=1 Tax=Rhodovulum sp. BSW8 TaxID=2259645 RepID=UPI000DE23D89|nr:substrate-binding domain-containing protein [Rhodovulum sp. BSW8]RBO53202.1 cell envelope biogenesis protein OmpA [Rhodovulum sp. BSW8]